uniref:Homing endonuclease LAGLIDADG domain-containing protein n=1 Tax=Dactylella sp. TaxID=1814903 RepID=A0A482DQR0_9PEZI|nr:hypothetical protein [Dactylella sp.]
MNNNKNFYNQINKSESLKLNHHKVLIRNINNIEKSSSLIQKRKMTTTSINKNLNPWFVTGFTDAEGTFGVYLAKNDKRSTGWAVNIRFQLHLHFKDKALLEEIKTFFGGVGTISNHDNKSVYYEVRSVSELEIIIQHFNKYPLLSQKHADFILFKSIVDIINKKESNTHEGILKIVALKASMNKGLSLELKDSFSNIIPATRTTVITETILNPWWLVGFASGEGCFFINISKSATKVGARVQLIFKITQHTRDIQLIKNLISYLDCGRLNQPSGYDYVEFFVQRFAGITDKIIPVFERYPLLGAKLKDYEDFRKAVELMKSKAHLTLAGLEEIKKIKSGMNFKRK